MKIVKTRFDKQDCLVEMRQLGISCCLFYAPINRLKAIIMQAREMIGVIIQKETWKEFEPVHDRPGFLRRIQSFGTGTDYLSGLSMQGFLVESQRSQMP